MGGMTPTVAHPSHTYLHTHMYGVLYSHRRQHACSLRAHASWRHASECCYDCGVCVCVCVCACSFGLLFFLFFLFQLSMSSLALFFSVFLKRTQPAVYLGFVVFIVGWIMQTVRAWEASRARRAHVHAHPHKPHTTHKGIRTHVHSCIQVFHVRMRHCLINTSYAKKK